VRALLAVGAALLLAGSASAGPSPTLRISGTTPLVVQGTHFRAGERVTITVWTVAPVRRSTVARAGSFSVTFPDVRFGRCAGARIEARGSKGSLAVLKIPKPGCAPASEP
jgi:hypothetical protein